MEQPNSLIQQMQQGSERAFSEIYSRYSQAIYGVIYTMLGDEALSEEVLQDVFVKVWNNCQSYDINKGRFYTWLLNIARNATIDTTRSKRFKNERQNLSTTNFVDIVGSSDHLDSQTNAIGIRKWLSALQPACIKIIELLYFKGFTQSDTAETLEIPLGTVKTRARNCIRELRTMIGIEI